VWEALFRYSWKAFNPQFKGLLDSLARQKSLLKSEKSEEFVLEAETSHGPAENHSDRMRNQCNQVDEEWWRLKSIIDKIDAPNCDTDQNAASEQRKESQSGRWVLQKDDFQAWCNVTNAGSNPLLYINGIPGAGIGFNLDSFSESILTIDG
jgi:hypothetical protein